MTITASFHMVLPDTGTAPEWVHLLPAGAFRGRDGRGPYTVDAAAVARDSLQAGDKLPLDENHATDFALKTGQPSPARGWIVEMQARADGVWGRVEWTTDGGAMVSGHAYRGLSPVFTHEERGGRVLRILRASLTNAPNLDLTSLHTQQDERMTFQEQLRQALGLKADADDAAIVVAAGAARTAVAAHAQDLGRIAAAAGTGVAGTADGIVTALQAMTASGTNEAVALQTRIQQLETESRRRVAEAAIDAAMKAGKPIPATHREQCIARHMRDPEGTKEWLELMPSMHAGGLGGRSVAPAGNGAAGLDEGEMQLVAMMGIDAKAMLEMKTKIYGAAA